MTYVSKSHTLLLCECGSSSPKIACYTSDDLQNVSRPGFANLVLCLWQRQPILFGLYKKQQENPPVMMFEPMNVCFIVRLLNPGMQPRKYCVQRIHIIHEDFIIIL